MSTPHPVFSRASYIVLCVVVVCLQLVDPESRLKPVIRCVPGVVCCVALDGMNGLCG